MPDLSILAAPAPYHVLTYVYYPQVTDTDLTITCSYGTLLGTQFFQVRPLMFLRLRTQLNLLLVLRRRDCCLQSPSSSPILLPPASHLPYLFLIANRAADRSSAHCPWRNDTARQNTLWTWRLSDGEESDECLGADFDDLRHQSYEFIIHWACDDKDYEREKTSR